MDKAKKPSWYTVFIIAISVIVLVIASVIIYSTFFEKDIKKEKNKKIAQDYMTEKLEENKIVSDKARKNNEAIISKYNMDITGVYTCTYNELDEEAKLEAGLTYTNQVTRTLEIKDDYTALFADGTQAWWSLTESSDGTVHMGLVLPDEKTPQLYLICDGALIDEQSALFIGEVPDAKYFDKEYEAGGLTLTFSSDGSVDGEYTEMVKEDDVEYPFVEAYRGEYARNGEYLDIMLNGADARYYIFSNTKINAGLNGFAARYYIKNS